MKKIAFVTTQRSEYGASRWIMKAIQDDLELELQVWCGRHQNEVAKLYEPRYISSYNADTPHDAGISLTDMIYLASSLLNRYEKPDLMIINGDRIELMPIVLAVTLHSIPIAHIDGGQISQGSIDNLTRYAISRYAHLHLVGDEQAAKNLIQTGEEAWRVHNVGQCGLENVFRTPKLRLEETSKAIGLDLSIPTALCIYYPSIEPGMDVWGQIFNILVALNKTNQQTVFVYPCTELGSNTIIEEIQRYCKEHPNCKAFPNLENQLFQSLMHHSTFMIGNSSCGVLEYPLTGHRTINVGSRQKGRQHYPSVINIWYYVDVLVECIKGALKPSDGGMVLPENFSPSQKIVQIIKDNIDNPELLYKKILL